MIHVLVLLISVLTGILSPFSISRSEVIKTNFPYRLLQIIKCCNRWYANYIYIKFAGKISSYAKIKFMNEYVFKMVKHANIP